MVPEHWLQPTRVTDGSVFGFEKNERANIADDELEALRDIAEQLMVRTGQQLDEAVKEGALQEICHDQKS